MLTRFSRPVPISDNEIEQGGYNVYSLYVWQKDIYKGHEQSDSIICWCNQYNAFVTLMVQT